MTCHLLAVCHLQHLVHVYAGLGYSVRLQQNNKCYWQAHIGWKGQRQEIRVTTSCVMGQGRDAVLSGEWQLTLRGNTVPWNGGGKSLQNVGIHLAYYVASQPGRAQNTSSSSWKRKWNRLNTIVVHDENVTAGTGRVIKQRGKEWGGRLQIPSSAAGRHFYTSILQHFDRILHFLNFYTVLVPHKILRKNKITGADMKLMLYVPLLVRF